MAMTKAEAVEYLTMQQDLADDAKTKEEHKAILLATGAEIGYAPAFRCLVKGQEPDSSIRWSDQ